MKKFVIQWRKFESKRNYINEEMNFRFFKEFFGFYFDFLKVFFQFVSL